MTVAIQEVRPEDWAEKVYRPDIAGNWKARYKQQGYDAPE